MFGKAYTANGKVTDKARGYLRALRDVEDLILDYEPEDDEPLTMEDVIEIIAALKEG